MATTVVEAARSPAAQRVLDAVAMRSGGAAKHAENSQESTMPVAMLLMALDNVAFPSASKARTTVRGRLVRLNGCAAGSIDRAGVGDIITWGERVLPGFHPRQRTTSFSIPVLFEDDDWAVVHKPAGPPMYAAPEGGYSRPSFSVLSALSHALRAPRQAGTEPLPRPQPVHRLDRRTEGLQCVAKSRRAISALSDAFASRTVRKEYHCIVVGAPVGIAGTIEARLDGRTARTTWRVLDTVAHAAGERPPLTLLAVWPHTGRTHQIRRHCAEALECPIVGEDFPWLYDPNETRGATSTSRPRALFSRKFYLCAIPDPITGATREFVLPDPPKFAQLLRRHGATNNHDPHKDEVAV
jgi:23S rRNA-/tRNA-specific pseudouridylate synthase